MRLSVVVPAYNAETVLGRCLGGLTASCRLPDEIIVVNDSSTDASASVARDMGAYVLSLVDGPRGPASARNLGAQMAVGDVLVFVDADVVVHPDALARIEIYFLEHPYLSALFGSYDDNPPDRRWVSRYKNLVHHFVHQTTRREASTFWAGCGGIRRDAFTACGGFDERYARPAIEDIELGERLRRAQHRIWCCPDVLCTHLKRWTLLNLWYTDVFRRAVPWSRLIAQSRSLPHDLNLNQTSRLSAVTAWLFMMCLVMGVLSHWVWIGVVIASVLLWMLNAELFKFLLRCGGIPFMLGAAVLHLLYLLYSSLTFAVIFGAARLRPRLPASNSF